MELCSYSVFPMCLCTGISDFQHSVKQGLFCTSFSCTLDFWDIICVEFVIKYSYYEHCIYFSGMIMTSVLQLILYYLISFILDVIDTESEFMNVNCEATPLYYNQPGV